MITKFNFKDKSIRSYAIRKLTPKECFRLMGVRDNTIAVMQSSVAEAKERVKGSAWRGKDTDQAISNAQAYKQADNSIVVDVLKKVYSQLWYPTPKKGAQQYDLLDALFDDSILPSMPVDNNKGEKVILTTFSGYDSQLMAADALKEDHPDFEWTCAGWSEIDKYACQMHDLVFPQYADKALGDITKINWEAVKESLRGREVDLFTFSSPCQDISQAGKQMGLAEGSGTRSALLWRVADAIEVLRPKYLLQENVAALVSRKFMPDFQKWLDRLSQLGYVSRWARLNAKDYGVPQNRDRVFCLSMRQDVAFDYHFPDAQPLEHKLADVLETEVEEKYFLKDDSVAKFLKANNGKGDVVLMQFPLSPTHEDAMFLKTWLNQAMAHAHLWDVTDRLRFSEYLEALRPSLMADYDSFSVLGAGALGDDFAEEYAANMRRKDGLASPRG